MHKPLVLLATLLALPAAHAQMYASLSAGQSHAGIDCGGFTSCSRNGTGFKLVGGYRLDEHFSLEAGYLQFAAFKGGLGTASIQARPSAFTLGAAVVSQLDNRWALTARLGYALVRTSIGTSALDGSESHTSRNSKAYAGLGMIYTSSDKLRFQFGVDTTRADDSRNVAGRVNFRLISTGVTVDF